MNKFIFIFFLIPTPCWGLTFKSDGSIVDRDGNELQSASEIVNDENNSSKASQPNIKGLNLKISVPNVKPNQIFYKNNELVKKYDDVTTLTKGCSKGFFKFGIYRNGHERYWIDGNFDNLHTQTVYYDNVYVYKPKKDERFD
jgi:hypothetical protein